MTFAGGLFGDILVYLADIFAIIANRTDVKRLLENNDIKLLQFVTARQTGLKAGFFNSPSDTFFVSRAKYIVEGKTEEVKPNKTVDDIPF